MPSAVINSTGRSLSSGSSGTNTSRTSSYSPSYDVSSPSSSSSDISFGPPISYSNNSNSNYGPYSNSIAYNVNNARNNYSYLDFINDYNYRNIANANDRYDDRLSSIMRYNSDMYYNARSWAENMSNTAIQRQVNDLVKAGLNPVLASRYMGAVFSAPNVPYISSVNNPMYNSFDSGSLGSMLNYDSSMKNIDKDIANNIRDNMNKMSIQELISFTQKQLVNMDHTNKMLEMEQQQEYTVKNAYINADYQRDLTDLKYMFEKEIVEFRENKQDRRTFETNASNLLGSYMQTVGRVVGMFGIFG